jgi:tripartite-type tricarboxylate transporter receptor subunit TctC
MMHGGFTRRLMLGMLGMLGAAAAAGGVRAQSVAGGRVIRIVVPFGAGGAVDIVGRLVARQLEAQLGQTVVVENRTGGGGNIAMDQVARAEPDGSTLLMASPSVVTNPHLYSNLSYDPATQLAPIGMVGEVPAVMLAAPGFEANDARSFIAMARQRPGHFTFGSGGGGTTEHLAGELLKARAGLDLLHVPYRGGAPAMIDLQAGRISIMFSNLSGALPLLRGGQLKALGIADQSRAPALPDVPTITEQGIANFNVTVWWGLMGPAGMSPQVVQRLNATLNAGLATAEMQAALKRLSAKPIGGSADSFGERLVREGRTWGEVIRNAGIKLD